MSFNLEDKIKWSELSPSLQNKFKITTSYKNTMMSAAENQIGDKQMTISWTAPSSKENNKDLWIDEKLRIARAYTEDNWEFTRAAWASGGFTPSSVVTTTPTVPAPSAGSGSTPTNSRSITYFTQREVGTASASRSYGSNLSSYRAGGYSIPNQEALSIYGSNVKCTITVTSGSMTSGTVIGAILYTIDGSPGYIDLKTGSNSEITIGNSLGFHTFLLDLETKSYSFRSNIPNITAVDTASSQYGVDFQSTTSYQYYFTFASYIATLPAATTLDNTIYSKSTRNGCVGTADPPYPSVSGTIDITVTITYLGY